MSSQAHGERSEASEPRRPLRSDFTGQVLRNSAAAKRRAVKRQQLYAFFKEPSFMKSIKFLRTAPGALLAVAVAATGSVGVYALSNWFDGNVSVSQNDSVFSVDLSSCKGNLPPGVEPSDDPHKVQFKIMGSPHVSAQDLQQHLLGECEHSAVVDFYAVHFPDAGLSSTGHPTSSANSYKYTLLPATVQAIGNDGTITLSSMGAKGEAFGTRALTLAADVTVYAESQPSALDKLKPGDTVMFLAHSASITGPLTEGVSVLDQSDVQVASVFKTHYNDGSYSNFDYQKNNVMPLDAYNQLPNGQLYK